MLNFTGNQVNFIIRLSSLMLNALFIRHMAHTSRALTSGEQQRQLRKANKLVDALDVIR